MNTGLTNTAVNALAIKGDTIFAGTGGGVYLSSNNGSSWVNSGSTNLDVYALAISGNNIFAGTYGGGVYLSSNNGSSWTAVNSGLTNLNVFALAIKGDTIFAGTYGGGVYLSSNNGSSWTAVNSGLTNLNVNTLAISGNKIFAGTHGGGVFLSSNNGSNWSAVNTGIPANTIVYAFAIRGINIFAGTEGGGVFLSSNNGQLWAAVGLTNSIVYALAISGDTLFAGTFDGGVWRRSLSELNVSSISHSNVSCHGGNNGTATVDTVNGGTPPYTYLWNTVPPQTSVTATGLAAGNYIVTITDANGVSSTASVTITQPSALNIYSGNTTICKGDTTTICISATGGVSPYQYLWGNSSTSSCQTVSPVNTTNYSVTVTDSCAATSSTLITVTVDSAAKPVITESGNMLFSTAATYYQWNLNDTLINGANGQLYVPLVSGVYSVTIIDGTNWCSATSDTIHVVVPSGINELSNSLNTSVYPNPVTSNLIIEAPQQATIEILDIQGLLIKTISASGNKTSIDVSAFPSGVYIVELKTEKGVAVEKFIKE